MPKYTITFTTTPDDARAFLDLAFKALTGSELAEVHFKTESDEGAGVPAPAPRKRHVHGTNGPQETFDILRAAEGKMKKETLRKQLVAKGYSPTSLHPFASKLRTSGLLDYNEPFYYLTERGKALTGPVNGASAT